MVIISSQPTMAETMNHGSLELRDPTYSFTVAITTVTTSKYFINGLQCI